MTAYLSPVWGQTDASHSLMVSSRDHVDCVTPRWVAVRCCKRCAVLRTSLSYGFHEVKLPSLPTQSRLSSHHPALVV